MGFLVKNSMRMLNQGSLAANCVSNFADQYASSEVEFIGRFKKIAEAAKPKFIWAQSGHEDLEIKANMVAILGAQFKPPEKKHMPQSASLSIMQSLDGFCDTGTPKKDVLNFLQYWERITQPNSKWADTDICDFANTIRRLRTHLEHFIEHNPDAKNIAQTKKLQSHLCYIEAGFYCVSNIVHDDSGYAPGPRGNPQRMNVVQQGFLSSEQKPMGKIESHAENDARELQHDVLITGLFDQEEQLFSELRLQPLLQCRQQPLKNIEALLATNAVKKDDRQLGVYYQALDQGHASYAKMIDRIQSKSKQKDSADIDDSKTETTATESDLESELDHDIDLDIEQTLSNTEPTQQVASEKSSLIYRIMNFIRSLVSLGDAAIQIQAIKPVLADDQGELSNQAQVDAEINEVDQRMDEIESGLKRILSHLHDKTAPDKQSYADRRHMLKSRLTHYLNEEKRVIATYPKIDAPILARINRINQQAEESIDLLKAQSKRPRLTTIKVALGGYSHKKEIESLLGSLVVHTRELLKSAIEEAYLTRLSGTKAQQKDAVQWLRHDYGLYDCEDNHQLNACLNHLTQGSSRLAPAALQDYCRQISIDPPKQSKSHSQR